MGSLKMMLVGLVLAVGCGDDDGGGSDGGGGGMPPTITMVTWMPEGGCTAGTASDFTVTTTATDPDTAAAMLTFSGMISGCSGSVNAATATITCPNAAPYPGTVRVADPEGNFDTQAVTIDICMAGSAP